MYNFFSCTQITANDSRIQLIARSFTCIIYINMYEHLLRLYVTKTHLTLRHAFRPTNELFSTVKKILSFSSHRWGKCASIFSFFFFITCTKSFDSKKNIEELPSRSAFFFYIKTLQILQVIHRRSHKYNFPIKFCIAVDENYVICLIHKKV